MKAKKLNMKDKHIEFHKKIESQLVAIEMRNDHLLSLEKEIQRLRAMIPGEQLMCSTFKDYQGNKFNYAQKSGVKRWIINKLVKWMTGIPGEAK